MRIVAGSHRGRILNSPVNNKIRPTSDKVRLALFNALNSRGVVVDAVVLDAFCGTGALGLEALSQGAEHAIFVDIDKASLDLARKNVEMLKETSNASFHLKDASKLGANTGPKATLVFLDPPYCRDLLPTTLATLKDNGWLADDALIVAEMERGYDFQGLDVLSEKIYGETKILIGQV